MMYALTTLLILVVHGVHGQNCGQCTVTKHTALDDHISPSYQLWTRTNSLTVAECGAGCYMDVGCRSFIYKGATTTCIGYASSMSTPTRMGAVAEVGARAYLMCTGIVDFDSPFRQSEGCQFCVTLNCWLLKPSVNGAAMHYIWNHAGCGHMRGAFNAFWEVFETVA